MNYFHGFLNNIKRFRIFYWAGAQTLTLAPSLCHNMKRELKKTIATLLCDSTQKRLLLLNAILNYDFELKRISFSFKCQKIVVRTLLCTFP